MSKNINRKEFIKKTTALGLGAAIYPKFKSNSGTKDKVRIGFIGTGLRGQWLLGLASKRDDVLIPAICDIDNQMIERTLKILERNGKNIPDIYNEGDEDFINLVSRDDLDAVIVATPWEWHHPMAVAAMKSGKHVGLEVPAAITVEECWDLVNVSEQTSMECMILENVMYKDFWYKNPELSR